VSQRKKLTAQILDVFTLIPLIKAHGTEKEEERNVRILSNHFSQMKKNQFKKSDFIMPFQEVVLTLLVLILVAITALLMKTNAILFTNFLVFVYILKRISTSFAILSRTRGTLAEMHGEINEIEFVFNNKDKYFVKEGNIQFRTLTKGISFSSLSFSYHGRKEVLKDISFNVKKGEMTALVGASGSGKSTILKLIMRFYDISSDMMFIDGKDITDFKCSSIRNAISYVNQDTMLFNTTLFQNITYGISRPVGKKELLKVIKKARLEQLVLQLPKGLSTIIGDRGIKLSGGEKQRVAIARALLKESDILILDEATSSLDSETEKLVQEAVNEVIKGKTSIVVAHRLSTIRNADNIIVLEKGRIIEEGSLQNLIKKKKKFYRMWKAQKFE
jgi:subfamily B ATP-binding cassette protein MsbA